MASEPFARGGQADITPGTWKPSSFEPEIKVAVKRLRYTDTSDKEKFSKSFAWEVSIMTKLSHENIIKLIGFMEDLQNGTACIVVPWEEKGNIQDFLAARECDIPERISLIQDVVGGVEYLHTREPPVCHGDLKSLNILVNSLCRAVITDFGSARVLSQRKETNSGRPPANTAIAPTTREPASSERVNISVTGTQLTLSGPEWSFRWAAPEVLWGQDSDLPSDMWTVGWVIWEIITGKVPFHELCNEVAITLALCEKTELLVDKDAEMSQIAGLCNLVRDCLAYAPSSRPTAAKCATLVKWMPSTVPIAHNPNGIKRRSAPLLLHLGYVQYTQNNHKAAASFFEKALASAREVDDTLSTAEALTWVGEVYLAQGRYSEAETMFSQAHDTHASVGNARGRAHSLDGLGGVYHAERLYDKAVQSYNQAVNISIEIADDAGLANASSGIAAVYSAQGHYTEAIASYDRAQQIYSRIGNELGLANSLSGLGEVHRLQERWAEAKDSFSLARSLHTRVGNNLGSANATRGMAGASSRQSKFQEAEKLFVEATASFIRIHEKEGLISAITGLRDVRRAQSKFGEADRLLSKLMSLPLPTQLFGDTLNILGTIFLEREDYDTSKEHFTHALDSCSLAGHALGLAHAHLGLGRVDNALGDHNSAESLYLTATGEFIHLIDISGVVAALRGLGTTRQALNSGDDSDQLLRRITTILTDDTEIDVVTEASCVMGDFLLDRGQFKESKEFFNRALEGYIRTGNEEGSCYAWRGRNRVDVMRHRYSWVKSVSQG
ncbi:hypothetical protein FRB90_004202, partial [Tulasnella sp. 427]